MEETKVDCKCGEACKCSGSRNVNKVAIVLSSVAIVLAGTSAVFSYLSYEKASTPITFLNSGADGNSVNFTEGSIAEVAEKVAESVVSIVTSIKSTSYFGQSYDSSAAGTGVIVTGDGYILTNKHVIDGANKIYVVLDDGATYEAYCAGNNGIQLRSKSSDSGVIGHSEDRTCKSITFTFDPNTEAGSSERKIDIYASNSPFAITDMFGSSLTKVGSVVFDKNNLTQTYTFTSDYSYIGFRSNNGAVYLPSIQIIWG